MAGKKSLKSRTKQPPETRSAPQKQEQRPAATVLPVVGFGASAGGLEAFTEVLQHIPPDAGLMMVLVQHLDPKHSSILTELLARDARVPVVQVRDGMTPEPNHVYVIPPNTNMKIAGGVLRLEPRPPSGQHMPVDCFFRSLAADQGSKAIGVILSGTASDGTLGLKAIKAEGGITFAQDPESARYDGMPRSAIMSGYVDFVLPPQDIARELIALCRHSYLNGIHAATPTAPEEESAFKEIVGMLRGATGVDFNLYKPGTIRRRTLRRMALMKIGDVADYAQHLRANPAELQALFHDILINVTGFFREPATFDAAWHHAFPAIFKERSAEEPVRIWVPGCSTGEEAFSMAICLLEYMREAATRTPIQIFGTDLSEAALEKARAGIYPESIAADVSPERLRRFFVRSNRSYQVTRSVRDVCIFARQNVTKDPPFSKLDLILCRNLLIYLGPALQANVFRLFHYALKPSGFLVLGQSESIGNAGAMFSQLDEKLRIYARKPAPAVSLGLGSYNDDRRQPMAAPHAAQPVDTHREMDRVLLARYSPPAVVVDSNLRALRFRGDTARFLEHSPGEATLHLVNMIARPLGVEIGKLVRKVAGKGGTAGSQPIPVTLRTGARNVRVSVSAMHAREGVAQEFLVVFEESAPAADSARGARKGATSQRARELEQELVTTRDYLQSLIEEQEAATEELKSAHEEVQSANEELQSTNEELLTAKEELQSTNEELTTVNEEAQSRNVELQRTNNDLLNLLSSVNIPILMLGSDLRIRRFTPQAEKLLTLLPTDVGRPIGDFRLKISGPDLPKLCHEVIDTLVAQEREVQDSEGHTFAMWVRPYRTLDNMIDGVVISLFDVTERRQSAEARYRRLFEAAIDGIVVADAITGETLDVNPYVIRLFRHPRERLIGVRFWESPLFANTAIDQSILARLHATESIQTVATLQPESGEGLETEVVSNVYEEGARKVVQFNLRDISARKRMEEQVRREEDQVRQAQKMEAVGRLAGGVAHDFNNLLTAILGYCDLLETEIDTDGTASELLGQIRGAGERATALTRQLLAFGRKQVLQPAPLDLNEVVGELQQLIAVMLPRDVELVLELPDDLGRIKADRGQMEQSVLNLVLNARDAMPSGGRITVRTANVTVDQAFSERHPAVPVGEYISLSVQDTGTGMDLETQAHLFEPFFTTKPKGKGAGLGLSTTYGIVKQCGGYIWAYSELGVGTTFTIYLPRVETETAAEQAPAASEMARGSETVLVVEDEPAVRALARRFLEQRGYSVLDASDPREALRIAKKHLGPIHLLLTDVVMPHMSGREVAFQLAPHRPEMKVLYMSGHPEDAISHHGVLEEGVAFLQKPFSQGELGRKVRESLDRKD